MCGSVLKITALCACAYQAARFEGTAMDGKVKVVMDGRMQPISVEVTEGALGGSTDGAVLSGALEAAVEMAFKASAEFYETTLAE
jgi:DNA-binding protein YbaB